MKKTTLALAVVTAMSVSAVQAEPTVLYGRVVIAADYALNHNTSIENHYDSAGHIIARNGNTPTRGWDVVTAGSRIGLKGGEELGNGLSVFYHMEFAADTTEGTGNNGGGLETRLGYVGLKGDWGAVAFGRQQSQAHEKLRGTYGGDVFEQVSGGLGIGRVFGSAVGGDRFDDNTAYIGEVPVMNARLGNAITYTSPDFSGFSFSALITADANKSSSHVLGDSGNQAGAEKGIDLWEITASYNYEGFGVNAAYQSNENTGGDAWGIGAVYQNDQFYVSAGYAAGSTANKRNGVGPEARKITSEDVKGYDIAGQLFFNDGMDIVRATYGRFEFDDRKVNNKYDSWAIGYTHRLSERTRVWVEYADYDDIHVYSYNGNAKKTDNDHVSIGIRHDF